MTGYSQGGYVVSAIRNTDVPWSIVMHGKHLQDTHVDRTIMVE